MILLKKGLLIAGFSMFLNCISTAYLQNHPVMVHYFAYDACESCINDGEFNKIYVRGDLLKDNNGYYEIKLKQPLRDTIPIGNAEITYLGEKNMPWCHFACVEKGNDTSKVSFYIKDSSQNKHLIVLKKNGWVHLSSAAMLPLTGIADVITYPFQLIWNVLK